MQPIVFVGGIHGAGKTELAKLLAKLLGASHVTAGGLIRENASASDIVTVGPGNKAVPDVDANQALLLSSLALYRARVAGSILLDGHFSLLDASGSVSEVPSAVFDTISPVAVLLVESDTTVVHARLLGRDGAAPPIGTLGLLARRERACAQAVCDRLSIPLISAMGDGAVDGEAIVAAKALRRLMGAA